MTRKALYATLGLLVLYGAGTGVLMLAVDGLERAANRPLFNAVCFYGTSLILALVWTVAVLWWQSAEEEKENSCDSRRSD